eukprot:GHVU01107054.1.p1 GENE.GHVU01107054.1~~GHVU01107054.1.p1  ORF type:complete len:229 (+),score=33.43 GHVU01107054.1:525-1211(+)
MTSSDGEWVSRLPLLPLPRYDNCIERSRKGEREGGKGGRGRGEERRERDGERERERERERGRERGTQLSRPSFRCFIFPLVCACPSVHPHLLHFSAGQLLRSCVELAKMWRMDRYLRHLQAVMIVADQNIALEVTGNGDVLESHDGVLGVGSGSPYAIAAARALYPDASISVKDIAFRAMNIAADMCVHTNTNFIVEKISEAGEAEVLAAAAAAATSTPTEPTTENRH